MSFSLFFVEDEITIREKIKDSIDWESTDYDYIGDAADGETALMKISELKPDIVVTDIRMPKMDGLELCKALQYESPNTSVVILSGYNDFSYAQRAISLNVADYLLKPITPINLIKALNRVALKISKKRENHISLNSLKRDLQDSKELLRERFFQNLLAGMNTTNALERAKELDIDLHGTNYCILLVRSKVFLDIEELGAIVYKATEKVSVFRIGYREVGILLIASNEMEIYRRVEKVTSALEGSLFYSGNALQISFGNVVPYLSDLGISFQNACMNAEKQSGETLQDTLFELRNMDGLDGNLLSDYLRFGAPSDLDDFLDEYLQPIKEKQGKMFYSLYVIFHLSFVVKEFLNQYGLMIENLPELFMPEGTTAGGMEIRKQCHYILTTVLRAREEQRVDPYQEIIARVKQMIDESYGNSELSLTSLAKSVNMSSSYLSSMFKKYYGQTISAYITEMRLSHAKELLRMSTMRTSEISEAVGYMDPNYFSVVFKKNMGMTPREYRNKK